VLVQDGNMARRKFLSDEEQLRILFNDDSGDELIPELDFSDSDSLTLSLGKLLNGRKVFFYLLQCTFFNYFCPFRKSNTKSNITFLQFMQTLTRNYLQGHELPISVSCMSSTSPALSDMSTHASTSSAHSTYQGPPKRGPAKDLPSQLDGKRNEHILVKFPTMKSDSTPTRRCRVCTKNKTISETK
jgi:hypothetical protein